MPEVLRSAIEISEAGFSSLPVHCIVGDLCSCGDVNCTKQGKHPKRKNWKHTATSDPEKLSKLFASNDNNLGIATGYKSKIIVIDIDPKNGGNDSYLKLVKNFGAIDEHTLASNTGGGGSHIYYSYPGNQIGNFHGTVFGNGIDIKGNNGYVIGAPSNHISGGEYYWRDGFYMPAELPSDLEQAILKYKGTQADKLKYEKKDIESGSRNITLTRIAGRYRARGMEVEEIESKLLEDNFQRCKPPLSNIEVRTIAKSISRYEKGNSKKCFRDFWLSCIYNDQTKLNGGLKATLTALSFFMDEHGGNCFPQQNIIGAKAGIDRRTANRHIKTAVELGWIKQYTLAKTNGEKGSYCRYVANVPSLDNDA